MVVVVEEEAVGPDALVDEGDVAVVPVGAIRVTPEVVTHGRRLQASDIMQCSIKLQRTWRRRQGIGMMVWKARMLET